MCCWNLNLDGRDTNYLMIFERRIVRKTFGPVQETDGWRIRTNYKLNKLLEEDKYSEVQKSSKMEIVGPIYVGRRSTKW
jgi:hypothetical protein